MQIRVSDEGFKTLLEDLGLTGSAAWYKDKIIVTITYGKISVNLSDRQMKKLYGKVSAEAIEAKYGNMTGDKND